MEPFLTHTGVVLPLDRSNVDTDQIIPKEFLKRIERTGFGPCLFHDWRCRNGGPNPDFILNDPRYAGASILLAGVNFGCGSSREHAVWALRDYGFRVVIAPSFADIFYNNCFNNAVLPVVAEEATVQTLMQRALTHPGMALTVDLEACEIREGAGVITTFDLEPFRRHRLLHGLDDIGLTLQHEDAIARYEAALP